MNPRYRVFGAVLLFSLWAISVVRGAPASAVMRPLAVAGPVAVAYGLPDLADEASVATAPLNIAALLAEDEQRAADGLPPRFALREDAWLTPAEQGQWAELDTETLIWRTRIVAPGAVSLNLGFTAFHLPKGGRLSIYPADCTGPGDRRGVRSFSSADNESHGELWTPLVMADEIIIELVLPRADIDDYRLELTAINRGYRTFGPDPEATRTVREKSGGCNVNVACAEGDPWRDEINSVGVISTGGSTFCSGVMLNNTAQDGTPYFLTANHCGIRTSNAPSLVVYWNFQSPACGEQGGGSLDQFMTGARFLAGSASSDFTLVEMDDPVAPELGVSFAGWDRSAADPIVATSIHHPRTDEKSISIEFDPTTTTSYLQVAVPGDGTHIRVADWDVGTTESGSSGSPLFDQNRRVVGQLHGGYAACGNDASDWYGRLSVSWPQIAPYLDPLGTGRMNLDTYAPSPTGLQVNNAVLTGTGPAGGPFQPGQVNYEVTNSGSSPSEFRVSPDVPWVSVDPAGGNLGAGETTTVKAYLNAAARSLATGFHVGTVGFADLTRGTPPAHRRVQLRAGMPEPVHAFNLDADPGWSMTGDWEFGVPLGDGGNKGHVDPTTGHTGANVLGFNLAGGYTSNMPARHLVSRAIDCSRVTGTILRFWRWLNVEQGDFDHASVSVSTDNINFTTIWENTTGVEDAEWVQVSYDISAIADGQSAVYLRWTMGATDDTGHYSGWNIDDIEILGLAVEPTASGSVPSHELSLGSYPNPFNPLTRIDYVLARAGRSSLCVYDLQGRLVRELSGGLTAPGPGHVVWDGRDSAGQKAAAGIYFVRLENEGLTADHKVLLLK